MAQLILLIRSILLFLSIGVLFRVIQKLVEHQSIENNSLTLALLIAIFWFLGEWKWL